MKVQSIVSVAACVLVSSFISAQTASAHGHEVPAGTWKEALGQGNKLLKTKQLEPAQRCFEQAVKDVKHDKSANADNRVECFESLAAVLQTEDITEKALPLYLKSVKELKKAHGQDSLTLLPALEALGTIHRLDSQYEKSLVYYNEAISILEKNSQTKSFKYAYFQDLLAKSLAKSSLLSQAEDCYYVSLSTAMLLPEIPSDDFFEEVLSDYIDLIRNSAELRRTLSSTFQNELLKDSAASYSRTKSVDSSEWNKTVSSAMLNQANQSKDTVAPVDESQFSKQLNPAKSDAITIQPTEAPVPTGSTSSLSSNQTESSDKDATLARINKQREEFYERMIAIDVKSLGLDHPSTARDLTGLAYIYISGKKYNQARPLLERALKIYRGAYGADPQMVKRTESLLSIIESRHGGTLDNLAPVENCLASLPPIPLAAQKIEVALRLNYLGLLYYSTGRLAAAKKIYAWALSATAQSCGEQSALTASTFHDYARLLRSSGNDDLAQKYEGAADLIVSQNVAKQALLATP